MTSSTGNGSQCLHSIGHHFYRNMTSDVIKGIVRWKFIPHELRRVRFREENPFYRIKNGPIFPEKSATNDSILTCFEKTVGRSKRGRLKSTEMFPPMTSQFGFCAYSLAHIHPLVSDPDVTGGNSFLRELRNLNELFSGGGVVFDRYLG